MNSELTWQRGIFSISFSPFGCCLEAASPGLAAVLASLACAVFRDLRSLLSQVWWELCSDCSLAARRCSQRPLKAVAECISRGIQEIYIWDIQREQKCIKLTGCRQSGREAGRGSCSSWALWPEHFKSRRGLMGWAGMTAELQPLLTGYSCYTHLLSLHLLA